MHILDKLRDELPGIAGRAAALDDGCHFPAEDMAVLRALQVPVVPLPRALGGTGAGTEPAAATTIFELLRMLGRANPSVARLFEAHVNVVRLVIRFGTSAQQHVVAGLCHDGVMFGLWVTDSHGDRLRTEHGLLSGQKGPCSGAGYLRHALVTVHDGTAIRMALVQLTGSEPVVPIGDRLLGMRASANGTIRFDGTKLPQDAYLGADGDYLREPDFSTGAWRTTAATLGGMEALTDAVRTQLRARGHDQFALQQARFGEMLIAQETARLWAWEAAQRAEADDMPAADQVAYVNLARIAVETACLDLICHAQRALGLAALVRPNPVERLLRDLTTYLRQPAPDLVLTAAAQHGFQA